MSTAPSETVIAGGTVLTPDERIDGASVHLAGDRIVEVGTAVDPSSATVDATGKYVLPGFVDVHGDDVERKIAPRPEARVPIEDALRRVDVAAASAGITTKLHALSFEDVPDDVRSVDLAGRICDAVRPFGPEGDGLVDHRLHLRCELTQQRGVATVLDELARGATFVSLVEHDSGERRAGEHDGLDHRYRTDGATAFLESSPTQSSSARSRRARRVVSAARRAGVPTASHDDPHSERVAWASDLGVEVCEFPLTLEAARAARERNMTVAVGAPNAARGRSLYGNLDARVAIEAGLVDVLCSDFRPQALVESLFVDVGTLTERVARVTSQPARTVGLDDRGRLQPGARADVVILDPDPVPSISRVFVAGEEVYRIAR
jgi:alpha-D-ribose 1-methylphosphonate 5-triphosphate diphosphatase